LSRPLWRSRRALARLASRPNRQQHVCEVNQGVIRMTGLSQRLAIPDLRHMRAQWAPRPLALPGCRPRRWCFVHPTFRCLFTCLGLRAAQHIPSCGWAIAPRHPTCTHHTKQRPQGAHRGSAAGPPTRAGLSVCRALPSWGRRWRPPPACCFNMGSGNLCVVVCMRACATRASFFFQRVRPHA
jgi:hypothetical protein